MLDQTEKSVFQRSETLSMGGNKKPLQFQSNRKRQATMLEKKMYSPIP